LIVHSILSNSITVSLHDAFKLDLKYGTLLVSLLVGIGILGGAKKIANIVSVLVPFMSMIYISLALFISFKNIGALPKVLSLIVESAFGIRAFGGATLSLIIMTGIKRGLFSNEAGMGSAPNAAASVSTSHPVKQGLVQTLGVFVDTLVICNATAFMILLSGDLYLDKSLQGITLVQSAITNQVGQIGTILISISVLLFSLSTIFGCYFYGETNLKYLIKDKRAINVFKTLVIGMIIFGGLAESALVWNLGDFFMGIMSFINLVSILPLSKYALDALKDYREQKKAGLNPVYSAIDRKGLEDIDCWHEVEVNNELYHEDEVRSTDEQKFA